MDFSLSLKVWKGSLAVHPNRGVRDNGSYQGWSFFKIIKREEKIRIFIQ